MRPVCAFCEGPRDVETRDVQGVELDVCRWCWAQYGPSSHTDDAHAYYASVAEAEAERAGDDQ